MMICAQIAICAQMINVINARRPNMRRQNNRVQILKQITRCMISAQAHFKSVIILFTIFTHRLYIRIYNEYSDNSDKLET